MAGHSYMKTKRIQRTGTFDGETTNPVPKKAKKLSAQGEIKGRSTLPSWQFGSHLHLSITNAFFAFGGDAGAHDWVDDGACCVIAHHAARCQIRVGAARQVERVPVKDPIVTDYIRRERGKDVQFTVADERIVRRRGRHLEFTIPAVLVNKKKGGEGGGGGN
jgi:hypothetical protein